MKLFIFLEINWMCWLPILGWMLGAFILGWLLRKLFGSKDVVVDNSADITLWQNKYNDLNAKYDASLNNHNTYKSKFEASASADAVKVSGLQAEIASLGLLLTAANNKAPVTVEKIVEKIVDRPVEKIVEKIVEKPTEDLTRINALNAEMLGLRASLETANNKPPVTVEKIVEKIVEKPTEDLTRINALNAEITSLKAALETASNKPPVIVEKIVEVKAPTDYKIYATAYGKKIEADDLKLVEGIGPKIEELFHAAGLKTWASVAASAPARLKEILVAAGERFQMHNPGTWPKQCQMMLDNKWEELKKYQDVLDGGVEP